MRFRLLRATAPTGARKDGLALKILAGGVLVAHTAWICAHLYMVDAGVVNPWKLGGYGMYTTPFPRALTHVYLFDETGRRWEELPRAQNAFSSFAFDTRNHLHVFNCRPFSERSLSGFFDDNPHLRYQPLTIVITEVGFDRAKIAATRTIVSRVEIAWGSKEKFGYRGQACDRKYQGTVAYAPPPGEAAPPSRSADAPKS